MAESHLILPVTIDSFTLDRRLGAGAMGEVYHAVEAISGREVAVKVMAGHLMGNARAVARFRREISAMGQLRHPGIPAFAGYGELPGGRPYLAMEYVPGQPLDAYIAPDRPLPEDLALSVAMQLVDVIGHCHQESGMIHRDLKPANIMVDLVGLPGLCERSRLRILDFGLAVYIDFGDFDDFSDVAYKYAGGGTLAGEVLGTPAYMSPEQIRGEPLTFHSDIYAIGTILHHLLTGHLPYEGTSAAVVMARHLDAPVPDPTRFVKLRAATVAVVQRAMAKTAQARYRSYQQMAAALQAARYATVQATRRISKSGAHPITDPGSQSGVERALAQSPSGETAALPSLPLPSWKRDDELSASPAPAEAAVEPLAAPPTRPPSQPAAPGTTTSLWRRPVRTPPPPAQGGNG